MSSYVFQTSDSDPKKFVGVVNKTECGYFFVAYHPDHMPDHIETCETMEACIPNWAKPYVTRKQAPKHVL